MFETGQAASWFGVHEHGRSVLIDVGEGPAMNFVYAGERAGADAFIDLSQRIVDSLTFPAP